MTFHWGIKADRRPRAGDWVLGEGAATPFPPARERCELPSGVRAEPRPPKDFPLSSALRMVSPDTIIYCCGLSCSHWGQEPHAPLACVPARDRVKLARSGWELTAVSISLQWSASRSRGRGFYSRPFEL